MNWWSALQAHIDMCKFYKEKYKKSQEDLAKANYEIDCLLLKIENLQNDRTRN